MDLNGQQFPADEFANLAFRIDFGFQPNASGSTGSVAEIDQDGLGEGFRLSKRRVKIIEPLNGRHP